MATNSSRRTYSQKTLTEGLVAVPSSGTDIVATNAWVFQVVVTNNTAGALTLLVKDKQNTPLYLIPTISIAANSMEVIPFAEGVKMLGGITWQASGIGLAAEVFGFSL